MALSLDSTGHLVLTIRPNTDGGLATYTSDFVVPTGAWAWVAAQMDFAASLVTLRLWVPSTGQDETESFSHAGSTTFRDSAPNAVTIGRTPGGATSFFEGRMSRWRLWGAYLSTALLGEVRLVPTLTAEQTTEGALLHDWRMNDGVGVWVRNYFDTEDGEIIGGEEWVSGPDVDIGVSYGLERQETFVDMRDIDNDADLIARALAKFLEQGPEARLEAAILPTGPYRYRVHYDMGDIVTVRNFLWNVFMHARIIQLEMTLKRGIPLQIVASFGSPFAGEPAVVRRLAKGADLELRR
jgi:hypothetical protein